MVLRAVGDGRRRVGTAGKRCLLGMGNGWLLRGCDWLALNEVFRGRDGKNHWRRAPSIFIY